LVVRDSAIEADWAESKTKSYYEDENSDEWFTCK